MTSGYAFAISRRNSPEVCIFFALLEIEGAGKTGCLLHPRSRVRFALTKVHTSIQGSGNTPAFPAQWLYGLLRALPGERLFCLRHPREASLLQDLAPAPRRPNHTTSPYASGAYVYRAIRVHRISPRVRDDREAPLICRETDGVMRLIWARTKAEYFSIPGLTQFLKIRSDLPVVPVGRTRLHKLALACNANQFAVRSN
jgi:hypothetical protein